MSLVLAGLSASVTVCREPDFQGHLHEMNTAPHPNCDFPSLFCVEHAWSLRQDSLHHRVGEAHLGFPSCVGWGLWQQLLGLQLPGAGAASQPQDWFNLCLGEGDGGSLQLGR